MKQSKVNKQSKRNEQKRKTKRNKKKCVFTRKHYNANDGILTSVWGPALWHFLHAMSFNYPTNPTVNEKKYYSKFINQLRYILPCKYCRINFVKNLKALPLKKENLKDRESFSRYIYNLHEHVNKMLNKTSNVTYNDIRERYEHFRSRCTKSDKDKDTNDKTITVSNKKGNNKTKKSKRKKESGCTEPMYGKKAKCVINIVPQDGKSNNLVIDKDCLKKVSV